MEEKNGMHGKILYNYIYKMTLLLMVTILFSVSMLLFSIVVFFGIDKQPIKGPQGERGSAGTKGKDAKDGKCLCEDVGPIEDTLKYCKNMGENLACSGDIKNAVSRLQTNYMNSTLSLCGGESIKEIYAPYNTWSTKDYYTIIVYCPTIGYQNFRGWAPKQNNLFCGDYNNGCNNWEFAVNYQPYQ